MLKRNVPDREGLKFCVAGLDAAFILMVELGERQVAIFPLPGPGAVMMTSGLVVSM